MPGELFYHMRVLYYYFSIVGPIDNLFVDIPRFNCALLLCMVQLCTIKFQQ